ncbi:unnamed protein product [Rotaria sp. Silwood2]|nr:unnamed protein product [Rotaria sp. Silwood2]
MNLKSGDKVPNLGCGVGGSLRRIAYLTGAYVTDITISDYQIQRAKKIEFSALYLFSILKHIFHVIWYQITRL